MKYTHTHAHRQTNWDKIKKKLNLATKQSKKIKKRKQLIGNSFLNSSLIQKFCNRRKFVCINRKSTKLIESCIILFVVLVIYC